MKNYNVNSLYVVGEKNSNHYFICKYNLINKTYEEIFTGEKIKIYLKQKDNERKLQIKQFRQKREKSRLRELKKY